MLTEKEINRRIEVCRAAKKQFEANVGSGWGNRAGYECARGQFAAECEKYRESELLELKRSRAALRDAVRAHDAHNDGLVPMRSICHKHGIDPDAIGGEQ